MTSLTDTQVVTASGGLVELGYSQITADIGVTGSVGSPTEIIAPLTVVCDGGPVVVEFYTPGFRKSLTSGAETRVQLWMDGSKSIETLGYFLQPGTSYDDYAPAHFTARVTPSAGSHTFGIKASVSTGTAAVAAGTGTSSTLAPAFLRVSKIVQATQWPAVTTGTIICTSSTRPASPFEGQRIYETDTNNELVWDGAAWNKPHNMPWGVLGVGTSTSSANVNSTSYTDISLSTPSISYGANRRLRIVWVDRVFLPGGSQNIIARFVRGTTEVAYFGLGPPTLNTTTAPFQDHSYVITTPSTAGSEVFKVQLKGSLTSTITAYYSGGDGSPRQLSVEDIGPA